MADTAINLPMWMVAYNSPAKGTSFTNEVILIVSGDSVLCARR
jgi:ethanolamine utilization microcompartment shell protein EutL